jgi:hypothetical protein
LLKETEIIKDFLEKKQFQREDFRIRIERFVQTIKQIKQNCPFEIRCNMFLIKTEELNNRLVEICEDHIDEYFKAIKDYVFNEESTEVGR